MVTDIQQDELEIQCQKTIRRKNHGLLNLNEKKTHFLMICTKIEYHL